MQLAAEADTKEPLKRIRSCLSMFIKLNDNDKSEITDYREIVYGATKLAKKINREKKLNKFVDFVKKVYSSQEH
jgi:hypothetical protein